MQKNRAGFMKVFDLLLAATSTVCLSLVLVPVAKAATTYLVVGTYRQMEGSKPMVNLNGSPSLQVIPMESLEQCEEAGRQITEKIYKPIWFFDSRWTCVEGK